MHEYENMGIFETHRRAAVRRGSHATETTVGQEWPLVPKTVLFWGLLALSRIQAKLSSMIFSTICDLVPLCSSVSSFMLHLGPHATPL